MWSHRFNDGFAHLLYRDGQEMYKKMKPNISQSYTLNGKWTPTTNGVVLLIYSVHQIDNLLFVLHNSIDFYVHNGLIHMVYNVCAFYEVPQSQLNGGSSFARTFC
jgi:hypothetical protein